MMGHRQNSHDINSYVEGSLGNSMFLKSSTKTSPYSVNGQRINRTKNRSQPSDLPDLDANNSSKSSGNSSAMSPPGQGPPNANSSPFSGCPLCVIRDNDPRVSYIGPWTLIGTQQSTSHSTTFTGAAVSLHFNGSGIVVFGTVPSSNATNPPPTAVYYLDGQEFTTTLPFAVANVPNQPLFATSSKLAGNMEHQILINITSVVARPYIFQSFFVGPNQGSGNTDGVVTSVSPANSATATSTSTSAKGTASAPATSQAASNKSASPSPTSADAQKTIKILAGLLGIFVFFIALTVVICAIVRRRALAKQKTGTAKSTDDAEKGRPETVYTSFTSTESILRHDSNSNIWSPFRSPRSQSSRGPSTQSTSGRTSTIDPPPPRLPPKSAIFMIAPSFHR